MRNIFSVVGIIIAGLALIVGLSLFGFGLSSFFAPKYRTLDNTVFKESEQYNDGMIRDLENLQMEYINADDSHKDALRAIVLHRFSVYPEEKMPYNLRNFYNQLRSRK
jgi:hypothetical protein